VPTEVKSGKAARVGSAASNQHLHLAFVLPLRNQSDLTSFLQRLYSPSSSDFHHYLSVDEFTEKYGPTKEDYQRVVDFAKSHGMKILSTPRNRMLVEADGTVTQVNDALHVSITEYQHPTERRTFLALDREPSIDSNLPIQHVSGLNTLHPPKPRFSFNKKTGSENSAHANDSTILNPNAPYPPTPTGSGPYGSYIPSDFRAAYYGNGPLDGTGQVIGLVEFDGYDQVDLDNFYNTIGQQQNVPINLVLLGGLTAPLGDGGNDGEPILDITYALSMTPKLSQLRVYECCDPSYSGSESGQDVILNSIASENIAKQISTSWGWGPNLSVDDPIYQEMAAQGQTIFAAAGDYGPPPNPGNDSYDDFSPADDAWVTGVSMSLLTTNGPDGPWAAEIYAGGAAGGYSDGPEPVPLPYYQAGIATTGNQASTVYRNVPDVVIDGYGTFLCGGSDATNTHQCYPNSGCQTCTNGGSSQSAPLWASYMALVNEEAANEGKPPIGFLNPALYAIGNGANYSNDFHDIIGGNTDCCGQIYGYNAVPGYDLVGGWGAPNGVNLINDLVNQSSSFSLLLSANAISIGPSDSASTLVSVSDSSGFSGDVTFSVSGLPSGVIASFGANPSAVSSNLTLSSNGSPAVGTYTVAITGTSGRQTSSAIVTLTVTSTQGSFTVGSTLTAAAIQDGTSVGPSSSNPNLVTVTSIDNFAGTVNLLLKNSPSGVTATFVPSSVTITAGGSATSEMTLIASATAPTGAQSATIAGSSGSLTNGTPLQLSITPAFAVGTTSTSLSVVQGQTASIPVYITSQNGFSSPVTLSIGSLPTGVTASFSPATVTPPANGNVASTLTLTATALAPFSSTSTTIVAVAGTASAKETVTVAVTTPPPAFAITSPVDFALNVGQNGYINVPIQVTSQVAGFSQTVTLSINGLPFGVTASFSPATVNPADTANGAISTLTVTADSTQPVGTVNTATITGTSGSTTNTLQLYNDVSGTLTTSTPVVATGGNLKLSYAVDPGLLAANNWIGIVSRGVSPQTPSPLIQQTASQAGGTASLNVGNLASGSYDAWFYYSGGNTTLAGPVNFTVGPTPSFSLSIAPTFVTMTGGTTTVAVTVTSQNGFASPVTLNVSGLPGGVSASLSPSTVALNADGSAAVAITLTGTATAARRNRYLGGAVTALALLLMPFTNRFLRRRRKIMSLLILGIGFLTLLAGPISCSSHQSSTTTPVTPATVTVTGTSGSLISTSTFTLHLQ
jgi:subtilase family serine protease